MSQKTSEFEPAIRRLERQAAESIDKDTDLLSVVREFDLSIAEVHETGETAWNARYSYESMVRAFYCKELAGFTTEERHEYLGLTDTAANQGSRLFDEETTRESGGPDGDTHLHYIKQLEAMEIASMVNGAIAEMVDVAKRYYSIDRHVDVAIDVTYIAYYGDRDEFQRSTGAPSNKSALLNRWKAVAFTVSRRA